MSTGAYAAGAPRAGGRAPAAVRVDGREPLRVVVDATFIDPRGKGLSRYAVNLLRELARIDRESAYTVLLNDEEGLPELPRTANFHYLRVPARPMLAWQLLRLPRLLKTLRHDVLHVIGEIAPFWTRAPLVLTATELPERRNRLQPGRGIYQRVSQRAFEALFPVCMRRASRIVSISRSTRDDLVRVLGLPSERVVVTQLAADERFARAREGDARGRLPAGMVPAAGYLLAFATGDGREDTGALVTAWARLAGAGRIAQPLVLAGGCAPVQRERLTALAAERGVGDRLIFTGYVDDEVLPDLYAAADVYADTSRYEGFGLQTLEAMSAGTAVVAYRIAAVEEVAGDAGVLVAPDDLDALGAALARVLGDAALRRELAERGAARAAEFSWARVAADTHGVYGELAPR